VLRATWPVEPSPEARRIPATVLRSIAARDDTPLHMPTDVGVEGMGTVFVADGVDDRVVRLRPDGLFEAGIVKAAGRQPRRQAVRREAVGEARVLRDSRSCCRFGARVRGGHGSARSCSVPVPG